MQQAALIHDLTALAQVVLIDIALAGDNAVVVGLAVIIYQPTPTTWDFGSLPLYYLAKLEASYYTDAAQCEMCQRGVPVEKVWI